MRADRSDGTDGTDGGGAAAVGYRPWQRRARARTGLTPRGWQLELERERRAEVLRCLGRLLIAEGWATVDMERGEFWAAGWRRALRSRQMQQWVESEYLEHRERERREDAAEGLLLFGGAALAEVG